MNAGGTRTSPPVGHVAELPGLYGPYPFSEKLLQKVWLLGFFETRTARLVDGRRLEVLAPGKWNLLGGPDFLGARLAIDGREIIGDVEVHFHAGDWDAHGHARDPAYDHVVLHVVLYEPPRDRPVPRTSQGTSLAQFALLPWLHCNLEEFASDDAIEAITHRRSVHLAEELLALGPAERRRRIHQAAEVRWKQKLHFAEIRLARLGWEGACHHTALEILGYRFNRAPMLAVAERHALSEFAAGKLTLADLWGTAEHAWRRHGVRPANHPSRRLQQYLAWTAAVPDWPSRWLAWSDTVPLAIAVTPAIDVAAVRRQHRYTAWREQLATQIAAAQISGARFDTLVANGLLPLIAARTGCSAWARWFCWFPSEAGDDLATALRLASLCGRDAAPFHEGAIQGLLQLALETPDTYAPRE